MQYAVKQASSDQQTEEQQEDTSNWAIGRSWPGTALKTHLTTFGNLPVSWETGVSEQRGFLSTDMVGDERRQVGGPGVTRVHEYQVSQVTWSLGPTPAGDQRPLEQSHTHTTKGRPTFHTKGKEKSTHKCPCDFESR